MEDNSKFKFENIVQILLQIGILLLILWWCIEILAPFMVILIWGAIIAISLHPLFMKLTSILKGKGVLASIIITVVILSGIVIPSWLIIDSLLEGIHYLKATYESGQLIIPPPSEATKSWPAIAKPIISIWSDASKNIEEVMTQHADQIRNLVIWLAAAFSNFGKGILQFIASIIIAGVFLVYTQSIRDASHRIFIKLAGENGSNFADVTVDTIRNVVKGILGVAIIQSAIAGIGFFIAGIPFAGLWTILALMFAIVQVGSGPVIIPVIIYAYNVLEPLPATVLSIWLAIALISDNVLKPILLGRNAPAPMLVIFLGAIGGFITFGFVGLFLGAVVLTLGYKLFESWINYSADGSNQTQNVNQNSWD